MERNYAIDYLKCYAIFFVILIHTQPFNNVTVLGVDGYYVDFVLDTLARFGVPFFFVASGFLFAQKLQSHSQEAEYFSRYLTKLAKIFGSWFLFYLVYDLTVKVLFHDFNLFSLEEMAQYVQTTVSLDVFFYGRSNAYQLWYLVALMWSIFILFIFLSLKKLNTLLVLSFSLNIVGLFSQSYSGFLDLPLPTRDGIFFGLFYTTLGCYLAMNHHVIKQWVSKINPKMFFILFLAFSVLQLLERGVTAFMYDGKNGEYFLTTIPLTVSLFLFALSKPTLGKGSVISHIGKNAVGIYVIHVFYIKSFHLVVDTLDLGAIKETVIWHVLFSPLIFIVSYVSYNQLQKWKLEAKKRLSNIQTKSKVSLGNWQD
jgi:surface polysaccharide O-acyltransferase-like enzyme